MNKDMVTIDMLEIYHELLVQYIYVRDALILEGKTICPNCGSELTSYTCETCGRDFGDMPNLEALLNELNETE